MGLAEGQIMTSLQRISPTDRNSVPNGLTGKPDVETSLTYQNSHGKPGAPSVRGHTYTPEDDSAPSPPLPVIMSSSKVASLKLEFLVVGGGESLSFVCLHVVPAVPLRQSDRRCSDPLVAYWRTTRVRVGEHLAPGPRHHGIESRVC